MDCTFRGNTKSKEQIKREYGEIIKLHKSTQNQNIYDELSLSVKNQVKNRYEDVIPLKSTTVRLMRKGMDPCTEYINANFVQDMEKDGFQTQKYISAQAPLPCTFSDFWRMIWEYGVPAILMLTNLIEDGNIKAEQYWPSTGKAIKYGDIIVLGKTEEVKSSSLVIRSYHIWKINSQNDENNHNNENVKEKSNGEEHNELKVSKSVKKKDTKKKKEIEDSDGEDIVDLGSDSDSNSDGNGFDFGSDTEEEKFEEFDTVEPEGVEVRKITQIHCTKWPDIGVPNSCEEMVEIIHEIDQYKKGLNDPILVHCSAGIGRTGTFVAIHASLHRDKFGQEIDVKSMVLHLRSQRVGMVQSTDQYFFIYKVLAYILQDKLT